MNETTLNPQARVFFALWPETAERAALAVWQKELHRMCDGRVMRDAGLHATLIFIGNIEVERLEALRLAAQEVSGEAFALEMNVTRYWRHNHIVYAAPLQTPPTLMQLVGDLAACLQRHGFSFDPRGYEAHVTLLRNARWNDNPFPAVNSFVWRVRDFVLVQSRSGGQGGGYEVLARFPLLEK